MELILSEHDEALVEDLARLIWCDRCRPEECCADQPCPNSAQDAIRAVLDRLVELGWAGADGPYDESWLKTGIARPWWRRLGLWSAGPR